MPLTLGIVDAANLTMTHSQNPVFQHLLILQWELAATLMWGKVMIRSEFQ